MKPLTTLFMFGTAAVATFACGTESETPVPPAAGAAGVTAGRAGDGGRSPSGGVGGSTAGRGGSGASGKAGGVGSGGSGGTAGEGGAGRGSGGEGGCLSLSAYVVDVDNSCVDYAAGLVAVDCAAEGECSQDLVCVIRREDGKRYYGSSSCFEQLRDRWSLCPVTEDESLRAACGAGGEGGAAGAN